MSWEIYILEVIDTHTISNRPAADEDLRRNVTVFDDLVTALCTTMGTLIAMLAAQKLLPGKV